MRALVTGVSSGGIGEAIARRLVKDAAARRDTAACIILSATSDSPELRALTDDLTRMGAEVGVAFGDLSSAEFPNDLVNIASTFCGGLDLIVSNAGVSSRGSLVDVELADWEYMFAVHVRAAWILARAGYYWLKKTKGSFIATGSISGCMPHPHRGVYPLVKAALISLCENLAMEWGDEDIRVNVVSPGLISTQRRPKPYAAGITPLGRAGIPEDIAGAVAFLAGPDAAYITGQNIVVDGGLSQAGLELITRSMNV
jgi:NAD(P)-dependent dehydrogenase (short-subunit alcohol dehydrogenase family)